MGPEIVTVAAGGRLWTAFERVMVRASYKEAARSFHLDLAAEPGPFVTAWTFKAGTAIDILFNGDLAVRGYVDRYQPRIEGHGRASIAVGGRAKAQDLIDASAEHPTGQFRNRTPAEIGQELDRAGVGIRTNRALDRVERYRLTPGETVFRCVEKLCREQGMTLAGQADGSVLITDGVQGAHAGALVEGRNIKAGEADHDWSGRHSKVIVRGQRPFGHGRDALEIEAAATDATLGRHRPVIIVKDDDTTKRSAARRAKNRRDREAGNALRANVTVQGFRDDGGALWTPGFTVFVDSPFLALAQAMLVEAATFTQSRREGSETVLQLVDPRAYAGQGGKGGASGEAWKSSAGNSNLLL